MDSKADVVAHVAYQLLKMKLLWSLKQFIMYISAHVLNTSSFQL